MKTKPKALAAGVLALALAAPAALAQAPAAPSTSGAHCARSLVVATTNPPLPGRSGTTSMPPARVMISLVIEPLAPDCRPSARRAR